MIALIMYDEWQTSAGGPMHSFEADPKLIPPVWLASETSSGYEIPCAVERTSANPVGRIEFTPTVPISQIVLEIRRRSGLTWDELGDLFGVSRRNVHYWANGKPVSADHEWMLHQCLAVVRRLDNGEQKITRSRLFAVESAATSSIFDLLKNGSFAEATTRTKDVSISERRRVPLSKPRHPPAPQFLLEAEQERPDFPAKGRIARAVQSSGKAEP